MGSTKVLFVGNSYTYCNDLPSMVRELAKAAGRAVEVASVTSGGKSLEWHWYNPQTLDTIGNGLWDFVVLQEHSIGAVERPEQMRFAVSRLVPRIRRAGAEPVLYLTWAREHIPEMQKAVTRTYLEIAREFGARVAPVGLAFSKVVADSPGLPLHTEDRSHPSVLGSYLAACVFYATLFGGKATELTNELKLKRWVTTVIDTGKATLLQEAAWASVRQLRRKIK